METVNKWSPNKIAMEACGSANDWSREFASRDIEVNRIILTMLKSGEQYRKSA